MTIIKELVQKNEPVLQDFQCCNLKMEEWKRQKKEEQKRDRTQRDSQGSITTDERGRRKSIYSGVSGTEPAKLLVPPKKR